MPKAAPVPAPASVSAAAGKVATGANVIELPLTSVIAALPMDLRAKLMASPPAGITVHLQAEMVINQLAFGAVKIPFGELRRLAPGVFVNSGGEMDSKLISLPLQEILPRLNPTLLARRTVRKIEVADEIVGPFAGRGQGFSFTTQPLKGAAAPASPAAPTPPAALVPPMGVRPSAPPAVSPAIPPRSITPAAPSAPPGGSLGNGHSIPISPLTPRSVMPGNGHGHGGNGNGHALPPIPGLRTGPLNGNGHAETPAPLRMSDLPSAPADLSRLAQPAMTIFVALSNLCESWPEALKDEILRSPLAQAKVPLESAAILPGLKRGRIMMPWKQLRLLAQPGSAASPHDSLELELPLKAIAPLFMASQKAAGRPQTRASVSADIPDLFFGFPQPAAVPAAALPPTPDAPAALVTPLVPPLPKAAEPRPQDTNYFTQADKAGPVTAADAPAPAPQTDFLNRLAHPKDLVARAAVLPGVAGSLVAMQDGLRVASQVPTELSADTLAAFLPQIFERVNQSTRELRMGPLNNVNFTVGNVAWKIFRVNSVYFAAFGQAGEPLPSAQLAQLAAELDRKKS